MDWVKIGSRLKDSFGKYKFVLLILCVGILLMTIPGEQSKTEVIPAEDESFEPMDTAAKLTEILKEIQGVGKVQVMLTEAVGSETIYQRDEDRSEHSDSSAVRLETVIISSGGSEHGLIRSVTPPVFLGAIIVCQGGGDPSVRLAITQAVSSVTGIGTDRITVLKMK